MTLNDFAKLMAREHSEAIDDSDYIELVENWTVDALAEMADASEWRFFQTQSVITTIIGTPQYDLPTGVNQVRSFRMPDVDEEIVYKNVQTLITLAQDLEQTSRPRFWYYANAGESGSDIIYRVNFWPVPDAIYNIVGEFRFDPTTITGSSFQLPIQGYLQLLLKDRVRSYMLADDKDYDGSDRAYQRFLKNLEMAVRRENSKINNRQRFQPRDISGRGSERALARLDPAHFS